MVPQSSIGSLLFIISTNDVHLAIKYFGEHHSAHDTTFLDFNNSIRPINKQADHDLKTWQIG